MTALGSNTITVHDILVGEVWLCAGQSNMGMPVNRAMNAEQEIAAARSPQMRLFRLKGAMADEPKEDCEGQWQVCSPDTVGGFSATGYYFGLEIHQELRIPVGLICAAWGGTQAESWISKEGLAADPELAKGAYEQWSNGLKRYDGVHRQQEEALANGSRWWSRPRPRARSRHTSHGDRRIRKQIRMHRIACTMR